MSKLYIVGTPIGNLKDITLRALETLKGVDVIASEDTRVTSKLLIAYKIEGKKLIAYHNKNERKSAKGIIELVKNGKSVAVVSDAGMPAISDPGYSVIHDAIENGIEMELIPGVSASIYTAVISNFDTYFKFDGFLKPKSGQRKNQIKKWELGTHIVFVSPHNVHRVLKDISEVFGEETNIFLGRELTKKFETHYRGSVGQLLKILPEAIKGEMTMAVEVKKAKINKYGK